MYLRNVRDGSIALSVLSIFTTGTRVFVRLRSRSRRRMEGRIWVMLQNLSDAFIICATVSQIIETVSWSVLDAGLEDSQPANMWEIVRLAVSYITIWCSRISLQVPLLGCVRQGSFGIVPVVSPRRRMVELWITLVLYAATCIGMALQHIDVCLALQALSSATTFCASSKDVGITHILAYPIATAWLAWNAHRTIEIEWGMSPFKWRLFVSSVGGEVAGTIISVIRAAMILAGIPSVEAIMGAVECGIAVPLANLPIIVATLWSIYKDWSRKRLVRSFSPVLFSTRTSETDFGKRRFELRATQPQRTLLSVPPSPGSPSESVAGSTNSLLPGAH